MINPSSPPTSPASFFDTASRKYELSLSDAQKLIKDHQYAAPIQTVALAKAFGINVFYVEAQADDFSGMIRKEDDGRFHIYVNKSHARNRRRFTTAHEIAHFILHRDVMGDGVFDDALYRSGLTNLQETEANQMAADILMPWHLLSNDVTNFEGDDIVADLAKKYEVSAQSMSIRLDGLNRSSSFSRHYE